MSMLISVRMSIADKRKIRLFQVRQCRWSSYERKQMVVLSSCRQRRQVWQMHNTCPLIRSEGPCFKSPARGTCARATCLPELPIRTHLMPILPSLPSVVVLYTPWHHNTPVPITTAVFNLNNSSKKHRAICPSFVQSKLRQMVNVG